MSACLIHNEYQYGILCGTLAPNVVLKKKMGL